MENHLLNQGLHIISQCKNQTGDIWHAHYGAAAIASWFIVREFDLPKDAADCIIHQSNKMTDKHSLSQVDHMTNGVEFNIAEKEIVRALEETIDELHWVGHNVIYSAYSLMALNKLCYWGDEGSMNNIALLIRSFKGTIPGRSWIGFSTKEVKSLMLTPDDNIPTIQTPKELSEFTLGELSAFQTIYHAEAHHDLIGHMLTFSHALNMLYDLGHESLFNRGLLPLFKLVKVLRSSKELENNDSIRLVSPVDKLPLVPKKRADHLPCKAAYWTKDYSQMDWDYGHLFKFTYSYMDHIKRVPHMRSNTIEKFRFIISD
ncbi:hypothetical protein NV379_22865 [Paenibacillus sp. N1-5-1-14]|uniref:hypothetical protein n=1 Tax=Paenibacillus radicibacter TaxID=2972488 RepID=UPI0021598E1D|nr:hypothetical protein [Paenibacillus radicibacter]MCR8645483.1 hypothetical protein [Paenibacillus radicibacter]